MQEKRFQLEVTCIEGFWCVTSHNAVEGGSLLVGGHSLAGALADVPEAINDLETAKASA